MRLLPLVPPRQRQPTDRRGALRYRGSPPRGRALSASVPHLRNASGKKEKAAREVSSLRLRRRGTGGLASLPNVGRSAGAKAVSAAHQTDRGHAAAAVGLVCLPLVPCVSAAKI